MILVGVALLGGLLPGHWMDLSPSPYKGLSQALQVLGAKPVSQHFGPLGMVTVVQNERIPFHYAPGLSLAAGMGPPEQLGLFSDGESLGAITRFRGSFDELTYLDYLTSALPYHLLHSPWVLVLGAGGGVDVLQALYHKGKVDAVELNPQVVELVRDEFAGFTGGLYRRKDVHVHLGEAREFVAASDQSYDLIQVATLGAFGGASAGLHALSENYLYTIEAFQDYLRHLNPEGMLAITRWLQLPPRDSLKLFATAVLALEGLGVQDPGKRLMLIRGWKTTTLVVKNGPLGSQDLEKLRIFCRERSFDVVYYPGMATSEANRFNVLERSYLHEGALGILGPGRNDFLERYKFNLIPATDDRPYFSHFFKWRTLPELLVLRARAGLGQLEWGYLILVATLVQALLAGLVLILLPLWLVKIPVEASATGGRWRVPAYFIAIGLAFLFLEIAFIQKFILFLGNPLYAVAVVLCAFLVFAGLGSGYCQGAYRMSVTKSVMAIAVLALFYLLVLPSLFRWALAWPDPVKVCCAIVLIAPLAFFMGMPFPLGMAKIARIMPNGLPWAWGINGCASVVSAVLATLLAMAIGFSGVVASAVVLYLIAALVVPIGGRE